MSRLRVAIVGAGLMGRWHARYARKAAAGVTAVVDRELAAARALARGFSGARAFCAGDDWLAACDADIVHVCTPVSSHTAIAEAALRSGRHVVVEKPVASSLAQTRHLIELAEHHQRQLIAVHQLPFQRGFQRLQRHGQLGDLLRASYRTFSAGGEGRTAAGRRRLLLEILPHPISLFRALGLSVATSAWQIIRFDDDQLELAADAGATRLAVLINLAARPTRNELLVAGTRGSATVDLFHGYCLFEPGRVSRATKLLRPFRYGPGLALRAAGNLLGRIVRWEPAYPGLPELLRAVYRSVDRSEPAVIDPRELIESVALIERIGHSSSGG